MSKTSEYLKKKNWQTTNEPVRTQEKTAALCGVETRTGWRIICELF